MKTSRPLAVAVVMLGSVAAAQEFDALPVYDGVTVAQSNVARRRPQPTPQPAAQPAQANRPVDPLDQYIDQAIDVTRQRMLVVIDAPGVQPNENTPWQIAHGVLALREDYDIEVYQGREKKRRNALEYIASGPRHMNKPWFVKTRFGGKGHPFTEKWQFEGHPNQFLAFFATAGLPTSFTMMAENEDGTREPFTIGDWIRNAQMEINEREEITWTLWAFSVYLEPDARWVDQYNRGWSIEKLVRMQMEKPPQESACGGMHGLFAIANALNKQRATGEPIRGVWLEAEQHLKKHIAGIKSLQNSDGSFSSNYLKGPEHAGNDFDKRISTTGHTLEFLMNALSDEELKQPWVRNGIQRTVSDLIRYRQQKVDPGGLYHACDALVIYRERTRPEFRKVPNVDPQVADDPEAIRPTGAEVPAEESVPAEGESREPAILVPRGDEFELPIPVSEEDEN